MTFWRIWIWTLLILSAAPGALGSGPPALESGPPEVCVSSQLDSLAFMKELLDSDHDGGEVRYSNLSPSVTMSADQVRALIVDAFSTSLRPSGTDSSRIPVPFTENSFRHLFIHRAGQWYTITRTERRGQDSGPSPVSYEIVQISSQVPLELRGESPGALGERLNQVRRSRIQVAAERPPSPPPNRVAPQFVPQFVPIPPREINSENFRFILDHAATAKAGAQAPIAGGHTALGLQRFFEQPRSNAEVTMTHLRTVREQFLVALPDGRTSVVFAYRVQVQGPNGVIPKTFFSPTRLALRSDGRGFIPPVAANTEFDAAIRLIFERAWMAAATELSLPLARNVARNTGTISFPLLVQGPRGQSTTINMRARMNISYSDLHSYRDEVVQLPPNLIRFDTIHPE